MVNGLVPTLVPPSGTRAAATSGSRTGLPPVPTFAAARTRSTVYAITGVDDRGRVPNLSIVSALGWTATSNLDARVTSGLIVVVVAAHAALRLTTHGHVRLPATLRHACGIAEGDRVLLAAEPAEGVLVIHPLASLDAMISNRRPAASTGGAQ